MELTAWGNVWTSCWCRASNSEYLQGPISKVAGNCRETRPTSCVSSSDHPACTISRGHWLQSATYMERLNRAVPDNIGAQCGCRPADNHAIVYRDSLGPQHPALLRALGSVVLERNGRGMAVVGGVGAHAAGMPLMALPVGRDYAAPLGWPMTSRRRSAVSGGRWQARRLHPFTVASEKGGEGRGGVGEGGAGEGGCAGSRQKAGEGVVGGPKR